MNQDGEGAIRSLDFGDTSCYADGVQERRHKALELGVSSMYCINISWLLTSAGLEILKPAMKLLKGVFLSLVASSTSWHLRSSTSISNICGISIHTI